MGPKRSLDVQFSFSNPQRCQNGQFFWASDHVNNQPKAEREKESSSANQTKIIISQKSNHPIEEEEKKSIQTTERTKQSNQKHN